MNEQEITLSEILIAREERVAIQNALLGKYRAPVISFTMNMAGPVKVTALSHRAFLWGCEQLRLGFVQNKFPVLAEQTRSLPTGDEAYFAIDAPAEKVKGLCVEIEESDNMGRLFDMDVIGLDGKKLERSSERPCIVCGEPGRGCASRRVHTAAEVREASDLLLESSIGQIDRAILAQFAARALLEEVAVTPKPGLVDRANNGAHKDMDFSTFQASAAALTPYWEACFRSGHSERSEESVPLAANLERETDPSTPLRSAQDDRQERPPKHMDKQCLSIHSILSPFCHSERSEESVSPAATLERKTDPSTPLRSAQDDRQESLPKHADKQCLSLHAIPCPVCHSERSEESVSPAEAFAKLRPLGKRAERDMLAATGGVNTHKGAIFTLGVLCGAIGRRWTAEEGFPSVDIILDEAAAMTRQTLEAELPAARWNTAGEALYRQYGTRGIRGEVADGLPAVREISLPVFKKLLAEGLDRNHAAAVTLLHLIAKVEDTNLLHRGGPEGAAWAKHAAAALIAPACHSERSEESVSPAASLERGTDPSTPLGSAQDDRQESRMKYAGKRCLSLHAVPSLQEIAELDRQFIERNLSPGGCADLLAVTLFLERLENTGL